MLKTVKKGFRLFIDRTDAAKQLSESLRHLKNTPETVILAIPRGGLAIGNVVAKALNAPLDIILTKKIGAPYNPELAIGAVTPTFFFVDPPYKKNDFEHEARAIQELLNKRNLLYRQAAPSPVFFHKTVIIVDDGIATGHTMYAALQEVKRQNPRKIIIAAPVMSSQAKEQLSQEADEIVSVITPTDLSAIGAHYQQFEQVSDKEAAQLLKQARHTQKKD